MALSKANKAALLTSGVKVAVPIAVIGVGVLLFRRMFKKNSDGTSTQVAPSLKDMSINTNELTISTSDAALLANTLYGAMLIIGTDEKAVFSSIDKLKSKDDALLLIRAFGMKKYFLGARSSILGQKLNLLGWLRAELNDNDLAKIKVKFDEWGIPI